MKRDRDFQYEREKKIGGKKGEKGDQKGETWKEIDAQHRPYHQKEGDKIQGLEHRFQKENFIVGFLFHVRIGQKRLHFCFHIGKLLKDLFTFRKECGLFLERLLHRRVFSTQMLELMGVRFPLRQLLHEAFLRSGRVDSEPFCRAGSIHDRFYGTHLFFQYVS